MDSIQPVAGKEGFVRDSRTNAFLSVDETAFEEFCRKQREKKEREKRIERVESRINSLEEKLDLILQKLG